MKNKFKIFPYCVILIMFLVMRNSSDIISTVKSSLSLCFSTVIPSIFPFMVLSGALVAVTTKDTFRYLEPLTKKLFGINSQCITPIICGFLCGFPIGAKCTAELYRSRTISQSEAESLVAFSNNPGPMFVIGVVGIGLFKSFKIGIFLYLVQLFSSLCSAVVLKNFTTHKAFVNSSYAERKKDFSSCVCDSIIGTLNICGFVMFFSVVTHLLSPLSAFMPEEVSSVIYCLAEITNGIYHLASLNFSKAHKLALASFTLAWSGFSVHMQVKSLISDTNLSLKKYYITKASSGVFSALVTYALFGSRDNIILFAVNNRFMIFIILFILCCYILAGHSTINFNKKRNSFYAHRLKTNFS